MRICEADSSSVHQKYDARSMPCGQHGRSSPLALPVNEQVIGKHCSVKAHGRPPNKKGPKTKKAEQNRFVL
jgi:hypothetical protein